MTGSTPHLVLLFLAFSLFHTIHLFTDHVATKCRLRQSNVVYDTYQSWTAQARSVTECATRCGQQEECISFLFWNAGSEKWRSCIGYMAEASILSGGTMSEAPGALLYDMDGRKAIYCGVTPTVLYADPSRYDGILGDSVTYECSAGYNQIKGDNGQRVCNASGTWLLLTGKTDPLCNEIICGPPPTVTNALSFKSKQYSFGDEVIYTCKKDKVNIAGANATGRRQCNQTGYWNQLASDPVCTHLEDCVAKYLPLNGKRMSLLQNEKTDEIRKHNTSQLAQFQVGDLIEFPRGIYSHWAVYIGEGELVHLAGDNTDGINGNVNSTHLFTICGRRFSKAFVCVDSFWNVVGDSKAFRNNSKDKKYRPLSPDEIVGNALMKLGEVGYNVVYENCEHFASWCRYGSSWSEQADRLVFWIKSLTGIASSLAFLFGVARVFRLREKNKDLH